MSEPLKPYIPALELTADKWLAAWIANTQQEFAARRTLHVAQAILGAHSGACKSLPHALYTSESSISRGRFCLRSICKCKQQPGVN